jgi:hypothetical protein
MLPEGKGRSGRLMRSMGKSTTSLCMFPAAAKRPMARDPRAAAPQSIGPGRQAWPSQTPPAATAALGNRASFTQGLNMR